MKTKILVALLFLSSMTYAQDLFDFGIQAGINIQNLKFKDFNGQQSYESLKCKSSVGYHGGFYGRFNLAGLFVQPELIFTNINADITANTTNGSDETYQVNFNRIDIPIIGGLKLGPLRVGIGPVASFNMSEQHDVLDRGLKGGTWGYQAGLGVSISRLSIDAFYEGPFSNTADEVKIGDSYYPTDVRTQQFVISLGYKLF